MIQKSRVDALLCIPIHEGSNELLQIRSLKGAKVSSPFVILGSADSCTLSCRVLDGTLQFYVYRFKGFPGYMVTVTTAG
jgi:hypothetical protein